MNEKQIKRTYKFFYEDITEITDDETVLNAIFNKFKEVFPFINESVSFEKYTKQMMLGESFSKGLTPKFRLGTINVFNKDDWKIGNLLGEANEVAGSEENMMYIAKTIVDNIKTGNDGKPAKAGDVLLQEVRYQGTPSENWSGYSGGYLPAAITG